MRMKQAHPEAIAVGILLLSLHVFAQKPEDGYDSVGNPNWINVAKPAVIDTNSNVAPTIRQARNNLFNMPNSVPLVTPDLGHRLGWQGGGAFDYCPPNTNPLPTQLSDAVVVATSLSFQPFLSNDKSSIYSELTTVPSEIVKDNTNSLAADTPLIILQRGGTLQLPDGNQLISMPFGGCNPIRIHVKYLLFLQYHAQQRAFTVARSWDLSSTAPREMDAEGHPHVGRPEAIENRFPTGADLVAHVKNALLKTP